MQSPGHWTEAERERVAELLRQGYSRAGIAAATGITRNAAGGRIFRDEELMAVSKSVKRKAKPKREPRERMHKPKSVNASAIETPAATTFREARQIPMPAPRLIPLVDLKAAECKWPCRADKEAIGGQLFCGVETEGGVWCPYHSFIGYTPPRSRS